MEKSGEVEPVNKIIPLLVLSSLLIVGCGGELVILRNVIPDENCEFHAGSEHFLPRGILDLDHPAYGVPGEPIYYMHPEITGTPGIQLRGATMKYRWLIGRESLTAYGLNVLLGLEEGDLFYPLSGELAFKDEEGNLRAVVQSIRLIPPNVGAQLAALGSDAEEFVLGVHIVLKGSERDGGDVESNKFIYPIEFCWGCLTVACPDGTYPACYPGQDGNWLDCDQS